MKLSQAADPKAWLGWALDRPDRNLHPLLGTPGYQLPDLSGMEWVKFQNCSIPGVEVIDMGASDNNWMLVRPDFKPVNRLQIRLAPHVKNNVIVMGKGTKTIGDYFLRGNGNLIVLCENDFQYSPLYVQSHSDDMLLYWGKNSTTNGTHVQLLGDGKRCLVGEDCMFSGGIYVRNSDIHAIIDSTTGEHKNPPSDILIEPHVWVGQDVYIGRKSRIGFGSIIGAKSVVTKHIPRRVVAAGAPAKVVNRDTTWDRHTTPQPNTIADLRVLEQSLVS